MSMLTDTLDKVANSLEGQGLLREAEEIDVISNTIEALEKEARFDIRMSPIVTGFNRILRNPALAAEVFDLIDRSQIFLRMKNLGDNNINKAFSIYEKAKQILEADPQNPQKVLPYVEQSLQSFMLAKDVVEQAVSDTMSPYHRSESPRTDMIFPAEGIKGVPSNQRRTPIPHPTRALKNFGIFREAEESDPTKD